MPPHPATPLMVDGAIDSVSADAPVVCAASELSTRTGTPAPAAPAVASAGVVGTGVDDCDAAAAVGVGAAGCTVGVAITMDMAVGVPVVDTTDDAAAMPPGTAIGDETELPSCRLDEEFVAKGDPTVGPLLA